MLNVIILAGDKGGCFPQDLKNKALLKIKDKTMIEYVVNALEESRLTGKIAVVGPAQQLKPYLEEKADYLIEGQGDLLDNALKGLNHFKEDDRVLLFTSDIPMLTAEAIDHFIQESEKTKADLCYPIVKKEDNKAKFPDAKRTYARLREGTFTGGNILYINPRVVSRCIDFAGKMIVYRKKPWKMCSVLGWNLIFGLVIGGLTIPGLEKRVSRLLDIKVAAVMSPYPEISNDVDKASDLKMAREYLENIS